MKKVKVIKLPIESFFYLRNEEARQRCGQVLSERTIQSLRKNFIGCYGEKGSRTCYVGDLGYLKEGRWIFWTIEEMQKILDEQNLPYKVEEIEDTRIQVVF